MPDHIISFLARVACLPAFAAVSGRTTPGPLQSSLRFRRSGRVRAAACWLLILTALPALAEDRSATVAATPAQQTNDWRFRVWLDDTEIGYHHFSLVERGDVAELHTEAEFEYRLLFVKLYDYEHRNREVWRGDCLQAIESSTDANGKPYSVSGRARAGEFELNSSAGPMTLPGCVMSFAYWNPEFLKQDRLINTQDGEYLEIEVSPPVLEQKEVRGELIPSYRYRLEAGQIRLDLWYSTDDEWLALESEARGGRTLRYELL